MNTKITHTALALLLLMSCSTKRHSSSETYRNSFDSLTALHQSTSLEAWLVQRLEVDSTRLILWRYDTAGRLRERLELQTDKRTTTDLSLSKSSTERDTIQRTTTASESQNTQHTETPQPSPFSPPWWLWLIVALSLSIALLRLLMPRR